MQNWYKILIEYFKKLQEQRRLEKLRREEEERRIREEEQRKKQELYRLRRTNEFESLKEEASPTSNSINFPDNIFKPELVEINDELYTLYKFRFSGLSDIYNYLKSDPEINEKVFNINNLSSIVKDYDFAGVKYPTAVERLVDYNDPKYKEFLTLSTRTKVKNLKLGSVFESANSVSGGVVRPHAIATGDPHIYRTTKIYKVDKSVNIYATASCVWSTTKKQVFNKAVILTNIIHALEEEGIKVNVDVFEISTKGNEILEIDLRIKNNGKNTNYQAIYRSLCNVEFLRRILFRVIETSDVRNNWSDGYGSPSEKDFVRKLKHLKENDYYFGTPQELGIKGKDIAADFERAVNSMKMNDIIDVEKAKARIKQSIKK